jgi:uncharacterized protein (DUF58 family)
VRPSPRLLRLATLGLLVSLAGFWWPGWVGLMAALAAPFLLVELSRVDRLSPIVTMRTPARVSVGQTVELGVGLMPRGRDWFDVCIRLETTGGLEAGPDWVARRLLGHEIQPIPVTVVARRRGEGRVVAVWFRVTGPLGLFESIHRIKVDCSLRISPNVGEVRHLAIIPNAAAGTAGSVPTTHGGAGTEFDELRAYMPGMDTRSIDWKASARHRELRARRYRQEQNQQLVLMLDNEAFDHADHAIHSGLALARTALAQGDQVALQVFGEQPRCWIPFGHGVRHFRRLLTALAELSPEDRPSNPVHAAHDLLARLRRRSMIVVLTDLRDPVRAELVVEAARFLQTKHPVVVLALRDPAQESIPVPRTLEDVAQALLRRNLDAERRRAVQRVRTAGISVVEVGPRGAAAALMQRYRVGKRRAG